MIAARLACMYSGDCWGYSALKIRSDERLVTITTILATNASG